MVKSTPVKTPKKLLGTSTPKSIKKQKQTPAKMEQVTPKSMKKQKETPAKMEVVTPKSMKKVKKSVMLTPQLEKSVKNPQSEKKKAQGMSPQTLNKNLQKSKFKAQGGKMEVSIQFPRLHCYKSALLQLLDTDKPIVLTEPINLTLQYSDRCAALEAVQRLQSISNATFKITPTLKHLGDAIKDKRVVYVPKKAPTDEAVSVLKKAYGASKVEAKTFFNETVQMILSFESEEAARASDKIKNKSYHGLELKVGSFFPPKKRDLDDKEEDVAPKKMKKEATKVESKIDSDDDDDDDDDDDESSEEEKPKSGIAQVNDGDSDSDDDEDEEDQVDEKQEEEDDDDDDDSDDDDDDDDDE